MDIEFGNAGAPNTNGTGWFIGFSDWTKAKVPGVTDLRFIAKNSLSHTLQVKWMAHPVNDDRGVAKPPSDGRTISILVSESGKFRLEFCPDKSFPAAGIVRHTLQKHGDFAIWGADIHHRWFVDEACTILTLRWIPVQPTGWKRTIYMPRKVVCKCLRAVGNCMVWVWRKRATIAIWAWGGVTALLSIGIGGVIIAAGFHMDLHGHFIAETPQKIAGLYFALKDQGTLIGAIVGFSALAWAHFFRAAVEANSDKKKTTNRNLLDPTP